LSKSIRILVFMTVTVAVSSGFLSAVLGEDSTLNTTALHVFLFNLAAGGLLILTLFLGRTRLGPLVIVYFLGALAFAVGACFNLHVVCVASALLLAVVVEYVRWRQFGWFPDFFRSVPVSRKFRQAALLCLSSGLVICAATLLNNAYLGVIHLEKLTLHVFFLGFSFPISLSAFSLLFERIESADDRPGRGGAEFCFWALNLGVIVFFVFIISEFYPGQLLMSLTLFSTVMVALRAHLKHTPRNQESALLTSALVFLTVGSLTGIAYVILLWTNPNYQQGIMLSFHSAAAVFGWNMTWIVLIARKGEYPLRFNASLLIISHWLFVFLVPFARNSPLIGIPTVLCLTAFLAMALFGRSVRDERIETKPEEEY